ncbi:MAG: hypothetical protein Phyf2KO_09610 [Phycisphaerales bacterium]
MKPAHLAAAFALIAPTAGAQPLPERLEAAQISPEYELYPSVEMQTWSVPGPHETDWIIAYDETPLAKDWPSFEIRLINRGRPVRAITNKDNPLSSVVYELTRPDGSTIKSEPQLEPVYTYQNGQDNGRIDTGKPILRSWAKLQYIFGELEPGEHTLTMHIDAAASLHRARDGHTIAERLTISSPVLRFNVIDKEPRENDEEHMLLAVTETNFGSAQAKLVNPFDEPLELWADLGFKNADEFPEDYAYFTYNTVERYTESGWLEMGTLRFCGTGMGKVTIEPGESILLSLNTVPTQGGFTRACVTATKPDGTIVKFYTKPVHRGEPET